MEFITKYAEYFLVLVMVIEFVLGKTKLVKANSIIESVLKVIVYVFKAIIPKKELEIPKK